VSARLRVAVPPATAEADERARVGVWPNDTDVKSRSEKANRAICSDRRARDFIGCSHSKHFLILNFKT
jgi:hypothetical protein